MIKVGDADSVRAWVVYPERATNAPVVVVVHEIFGLSTWIRAVADQLAADGFIAIAPDFLTGRIAPDASDSVLTAQGPALIRALDAAEVQRRISAAGEYGMSLPAAAKKYGVVGFCWGGSVSFAHAVAAPTLGASVVYYGTSPASDALASVRAPVLGLYGSDDQRVNATVPAADSTMKALGKTYEHETYTGAGHGFLRQQDQRQGANLEASRQAWQRTVEWFRKYLAG
jgi:carboxymethylenebutenolidase